MSTWSIYVIYDTEHDTELRVTLNSAMGSRIISWSDPERSTGHDWAKHVRDEIERAAAVLVMCSAHTASAPEVDAELRIAQERGKPYFLIRVGSEEAKPPPSARAADLILTLPNGSG